MKRKVEIVVDEHDIAMLELLHDEIAPLKTEEAALLKVLNQIVAKNDSKQKKLKSSLIQSKIRILPHIMIIGAN